MPRLAAIAVVFALLGAARAQTLPAGNFPMRSASGQFVVYAAPPAMVPSGVARLGSSPGYVSVDPALLVVSCERLKQKLWRELGVTGPWRGKIYLELHRVRAANEVVTVVSEKFKDGWNYRVLLPDVLPRDRFILAMTQVMLFELANRNPGPRTAEIPAWMTEGFAGDLGAAGELDIVLTRPTRSVNGLTLSLESTNKYWSDPLEMPWQAMRAQPPLTYAQLSWPADGQLNGAAGEFYRANAQLFVSRLLRLEGGRDCFQAMLRDLPRYYNWQTAFQDAFRRHFETPLDVEKWWALQVVQFTGRELTQTWTPEESWRKFEEVIRPPVEIRAGTNELPLHSEVNLQTSLREWDRARQAAMLQRKLVELNLLRQRVVPELVPLVDDYRGVLQNYLSKRNQSLGILFLRKRSTWTYDRLTEETIQRLDALDAVRAAQRPDSPVAASGL